ncbi:MAG: TlpA family protein disulfide reductase [Snodgrassella sp.]|uniref:TlpA family protein disulfide reductase n=1 Tax=Snodgrassella sp. TaxID=2815304 RepID=UPI00258C92A8|nr:TlpA disulfide reductase family protein [Snodgrassella sp.]MCO6508402.1 TlpA family protein disulfide reductase [Snodgrassella sp.]
MFQSAELLKKIYLFSLLFFGCIRLQAAELQSWPQGKATVLPTNNPILVINVWATWCAPCRKEMPMLSRWYQQQLRSGKGTVAVVGVALDSEANLQRFTRQVSVRYPLFRYTGTDSRAWMRRLGNEIGGIPYTQVQASKCGFRQALLGTLTEAKLNQAIAAAKRRCAERKVRL